LVEVNYKVYDTSSGEFVDVTQAVLDSLYTDSDGSGAGFKLTIRDINSSEIYESAIKSEDFVGFTTKGTPDSIFEIPKKPSKNSTSEGIFDSLGRETFEISISRTTKTTSDVISKRNIKLI
jgi:hypothetical protein